MSPRVLLFINRRTGVAHSAQDCEAIVHVPARYLRLEPFDPARPRRLCSRCWIGGRPRSRAFAGEAAPVTERSEGNPRSGLTGDASPATPAAERAAALGLANASSELSDASSDLPIDPSLLNASPLEEDHVGVEEGRVALNAELHSDGTPPNHCSIQSNLSAAIRS